MDTFKEKQLLDDMYARGETPWEVWKKQPEVRAPSTSLVLGAATQGLRPISVEGERSSMETTPANAAA